VPIPDTVAATVNTVELTDVTVHVTPVAVPAFVISEAVKLPVFMASENVIVKFAGNELT
jgi:hypothetical protein